MNIDTIKSYVKIIEFLKDGNYTREEVGNMLGNKVGEKAVQNYLNGQVGAFYGFYDKKDADDDEKLILKKGKRYTLNIDNFNSIRDVYNITKNIFEVTSLP